jgi:hypothetical protein
MPSFESPLPYRPDRSTFWPQSFYNLRVDGLPVHSESAADIAAAAANCSTSAFKLSAIGQTNWDNGNGSGYWSDRLPAGTDTSFDSSARRTWVVNQSSPQHVGKHLWFSNLRQQGATKVAGQYTPLSVIAGGDKHAILWSPDSDELMEAILFRADPNFPPECSHQASWDLQSYELPVGANGTNPVGATATRFPVAPLQFCYQDLLDCGTTGDLGHMMGFALDAPGLRNGFVWPARAEDAAASTGLPEGAIIRLKSTFNVAGLATAPLRAMARTLQRHGMVLFDRSSFPNITAVNDPAWPSSTFGDNIFDLTDFERVDISSVATAPWTRNYPLEPPAGTIRVGVTQTSGSVVTKHETPTGQPLGMHRRFVSNWAQKASGSTTRWQVTKEVIDASEANRTIHVSTKTPAWQAVANGNHDAEATTLFTQLRDTYTCCWVSFWHEPENDLDLGSAYTATHWRNMQLRLESLRAAAGADNVLIVPVLIDETIQNGGGSSWVIEDTSKFPLYGIDFYSQNYSTGPLDLRANARFNANISYLTSRGIDVCFPELGGTIGTTGERDPLFLSALINEALDPANRIKAFCWFDDGNNELGGTAGDPSNPASDPDGEVLAVFHAALTADYSYRGGGRRASPSGLIGTIKVTDTTPDVTVPDPDEQVIRRRIAGTWVDMTVKRRVAGQWVTQAVRRITA